MSFLIARKNNNKNQMYFHTETFEVVHLRSSALIISMCKCYMPSACHMAIRSGQRWYRKTVHRRTQFVPSFVENITTHPSDLQCL